MTDADPRVDTDVALIVLDDTGMIVDWSDAAAALFGYSLTSLLGRYFDAIVPADHADAAWKLFETAMSGADDAAELDGRTLHLPIACADGETRVFPARLALLRDPAGVPCAAAATLTAAVDVAAFTPLP